MPGVFLGMESLCRAFYWAWKVCAGCFIAYDKSVPGVILGVTVCAGCFIGYDKSVPGVLLGMTSLCRVFYWV